MAAGEVSAVAVSDHFLQRISDLDPTLHCFRQLDLDGIRRHARAADDAQRHGRVVGPLHVTPGTPANDAALVILARQGPCSFLLPADAESRPLLGDRLTPVGVLNVSHHGSADTGLGRLLAQLRPRLAVISVGAHNSYGHPAPSTLAALAQAGVPVRRTDRDGEIALACERGG